MPKKPSASKTIETLTHFDEKRENIPTAEHKAVLDEEQKKHHNMTTTLHAASSRFWVEKTIVKDRLDRKEGPHALGSALWVPQRAAGNKDIYRLMREVREGDIVFHFIDNMELMGVSVAASQADESFTGVEGTEWAGRACYRIPLREYRQFTPSIHRTDFLAENNYRSRISNMLEKHRGLFFNREFKLNQGS